MTASVPEVKPLSAIRAILGSQLYPLISSWAVDVVVPQLEIMLDTQPEVVYRYLLFINPARGLGRFTKDYQDRFREAEIRQDEKKILEMIKNPWSRELDANPHLTAELQVLARSQLESELSDLDLEITLARLEHYNRGTYSSAPSVPQCVWLGHKGEAWCFNLLHLLRLIINNDPNPYTKVPFPPELRQTILQRYPLEVKLLS